MSLLKSLTELFNADIFKVLPRDVGNRIDVGVSLLRQCVGVLRHVKNTEPFVYRCLESKHEVLANVEMRARPHRSSVQGSKSKKKREVAFPIKNATTYKSSSQLANSEASNKMILYLTRQITNFNSVKA
jgi:hypothetical protein